MATNMFFPKTKAPSKAPRTTTPSTSYQSLTNPQDQKLHIQNPAQYTAAELKWLQHRHNEGLSDPSNIVLKETQVPPDPRTAALYSINNIVASELAKTPGEHWHLKPVPPLFLKVWGPSLDKSAREQGVRMPGVKVLGLGMGSWNGLFRSQSVAVLTPSVLGQNGVPEERRGGMVDRSGRPWML
ncbi:hypothetical protein LTR37_017433 [Vermiconidia calcicola]|uniref:Uncharacterized protein n=1 Tax=Vermiconidia calcicola TaxID=1690605 RepID=A0ACC3MLK9_9PEZI|nr:hypothetical protein LTR37_017433 [Vermiconidia calcicola]